MVTVPSAFAALMIFCQSGLTSWAAPMTGAVSPKAKARAWLPIRAATRGILNMLSSQYPTAYKQPTGRSIVGTIRDVSSDHDHFNYCRQFQSAQESPTRTIFISPHLLYKRLNSRSIVMKKDVAA
jgi:hypothetical protein